MTWSELHFLRHIARFVDLYRERAARITPAHAAGPAAAAAAAATAGGLIITSVTGVAARACAPLADSPAQSDSASDAPPLTPRSDHNDGGDGAGGEDSSGAAQRDVARRGGVPAPRTVPRGPTLRLRQCHFLALAALVAACGVPWWCRGGWGNGDTAGGGQSVTTPDAPPDVIQQQCEVAGDNASAFPPPPCLLPPSTLEAGGG